jgi:diphthamide synthase (EF-2-diphthine--ammonia ligase)
VPFPEWTNQLTSRETEELRPLLEDLERLKTEGLTGGAVAISFIRRLLQQIEDRVHPTYEYWGQSDPTWIIRRKVSKEEMVARVKNIFTMRIRNRECPKALSVYRPSVEVSL